MIGTGPVRSTARRCATVLLVLAVLVGPAQPTTSPTAQAAPAAGEDVCPEPNDGFQNACNLGPGSDALGFLSSPDDVDAYRIVALDFNARVTVTLTGQPYRLQLYDWNGTVIGESTDGAGGQALSTTLPLPGAYYVGVVSPTGAFSDGVPYRIGAQFTYVAGAPQILFSGEFREGGVVDGYVGDDPDMDYHNEGGRYVVKIKRSGTTAVGEGGWSYLGPRVRDFVFAVDTRIVSGSLAAATIGMRRSDPNNSIRFLMDSAGKVALGRLNGGTRSDIVGWQQTTAVRTDGSVNRIVIRYVGAEIVVNVNGTEVIRAADDSNPAGQIGLGVVTWAEPAEVYYDNVLIATPAGVASSSLPSPRAPAAGDIVLADNFDNPSAGRLPKQAVDPTKVQLGYVGGEYVVKRLDLSLTGGVGAALTDTPSDGTLAVDARIVGDTDGRYVELRCRYRNNGADFYVMAVMPHDGVYQILRISGGRTVPPEVWRESAAIRRDNATNHLELTCAGSSLSASINGQKVLDLQDNSIPDGIFVIAAGNTTQKPGLVEVRFDNLVLTRR